MVLLECITSAISSPCDRLAPISMAANLFKIISLTLSYNNNANYSHNSDNRKDKNIRFIEPPAMCKVSTGYVSQYVMIHVKSL